MEGPTNISRQSNINSFFLDSWIIFNYNSINTVLFRRRKAWWCRRAEEEAAEVEVEVEKTITGNMSYYSNKNMRSWNYSNLKSPCTHFASSFYPHTSDVFVLPRRSTISHWSTLNSLSPSTFSDPTHRTTAISYHLRTNTNSTTPSYVRYARSILSDGMTSSLINRISCANCVGTVRAGFMFVQGTVTESRQSSRRRGRLRLSGDRTVIARPHWYVHVPNGS